MDTTYDANGRILCVTNPYTSTIGASTCMTGYDGLDRPLSQLLQDNVSIKAWSYGANTTTSTDERGVSWTRTKDAFGRLTQVTEPGGTQTSYSYDVLGNLHTINQVGAAAGDTPRVRSFTYDSLSRLVCALNPESSGGGNSSGSACPLYAGYGSPAGAITYTYDLNGNVLSKTDAAGDVVSMSYDPLNRVISKSDMPDNGKAHVASQYSYDGNVGAGARVVFWGRIQTPLAG